MSGADHRKRLLAILAADAAGYSRLMAGDPVLAVFELATGAVTAALAIQQKLNSDPSNVPANRRMHFRIGVHLGEIIEKADGTV